MPRLAYGPRFRLLTASSVVVFCAELAICQDPAIVRAPAKVIAPTGEGGVFAISLAEDNNTLAVALSGRGYHVILCDCERGTVIRDLGSQAHVATSLRFTNKAATLFTGCSPIDKPQRYSLIKRWDVARGVETAAFTLPEGGAVYGISRDGKRAITVRGFPQRIARVWDIGSGEETASLDGGPELPHADCAAFSPDGKAIAIGGGKYEDGVLHVWGGASFKEKRRWRLEGGHVGFITFSPKGDLVACGTEVFPQGGVGGVWVGGLEVCEYPSGKRLPFKLRTKLQHCEFTPDGRHLAVSTSRHIELWNIDTRKLVAKFTAAQGTQGKFSQLLAISPDGKTLAGVSNQRDIVLWNVPKLGP